MLTSFRTIVFVAGLSGLWLAGCRNEKPSERQKAPATDPAPVASKVGADTTPEVKKPDNAQPSPTQTIPKPEQAPSASVDMKPTAPEGTNPTSEITSPTPGSSEAQSSDTDPEVKIIEEPNKQGGLRLRREVKAGPDGQFINHGKVKEFMETGELWKESHWVDGVKHGAYTEWYRNGNVAQIGEFDQGKMIKTWIWFTDGGQKQREGTFNAANQRHGTWTYWDKDGKKLREELWDSGVKVR